MTVMQAAASGIAVLILSACSAGIGIGAEPLETAKASTVDQCATDAPTCDPSKSVDPGDPPCGYDVYKGKVYVTSLGKAHGTVRVIKWTKPYGYDGKPHGIGTLVATKTIKRRGSVTINRPKHTKANRITVDIVKGKLTKNETPRRTVWKCEPA